MRNKGLKEIYALAKKDKRVIFIGSDLGKGTLDDFKNELPDQFYMEGISEQNIIGMAAGLAQTGKIVYVNTIATFLTRRCFDQLAVDVCSGNHNVRLYANGGGAVYALLGPTHIANDDIALMRSLPNMTIIHPSDADEMIRAVQASLDHQGPIYFRLCKGGEKVTSKSEHGFTIGKAIVLEQPKDLLFITCGTLVYRALEVCKMLAPLGIQAGVVNVHTLKPLDNETINKYLKQIPNVMSLEEHNITNGLGSAIAELIAEMPGTKKCNFKRLGMPDCFPDKYGSQDSMIRYYGININSIFDQAKQMLNLM